MKYNIALSGTFNVENYGDLMFPEVFKKAMEKRGLDFNLFLFSPEKSSKKALDDNTTVYAISEIDKIHKEHPLDAVVIGGGALVHYNKIAVKFPDSENVVDYKIYESWYMPIEFAIRNNIKILFNLPQVPFEFSDSIAAVTRAAFDNSDYISFRDNQSKEYLSKIYKNGAAPQIEILPDSVCCLPDLVNITELEGIKNSILNFDDDYAVVQFNPQKPEQDNEYLLKIISRLKAENLKVILLPIGYTHNDDRVLTEFNSKYGADCEIISQKLNIFETAAVLACCKIYIGSSFHGSITAIAYGKKAISYNYIYPKTKNREIFEMYGISDFVAENAKDAFFILENLFNNKIEFNPQLDCVMQKLNVYFDNLFTLITSGGNKAKNYIEFAKPVFDLIPETAVLENNQKDLYAELERCNTYIKNLEKLKASNDIHINNLESYINNLENNIDNLEGYVKDLENNNLELNKQITSITNGFYWKLTAPIRYILRKAKQIFSKK